MKKFKFVVLFLLVLGLASSSFAQKYKPSVQFNSMLWNAFEIMRHTEGGIFVHKNLYATNMPASNRNGTAVVRLNGKEIGVFSWLALPRDPLYTQMIQFQLVKGKKHPLGLIITSGGDYEIEYRLANGTPFYKFPFKMMKKGGGNSYDPYATWKLEGDWENYAYLIFDEKGTRAEKLRFVYWLRGFGNGGSALITAEISRDSDGAKIARASNTVNPSLHWHRHDLSFTATFDPKGIPFKMETLKSKNGKYTLSLKVDGKTIRQYKFEIKNGEIPVSGRQVRESADPLRFIEGGGRAIWLKKM